MTAFFKKISNADWFGTLVLWIIILASVLVGLETYKHFGDGTSAGGVINLLQQIVLGFFILEAVIKIGSQGAKPWLYFKDPWNVFDFIVIVLCLLPMENEYAPVLRLARIFRALRLVTALPRLQVLVTAMINSLPSLVYIGGFLFLHFYVYAVIGTTTFRQNDPIRFGNLHKSFLTLFEVVTLETWVDIMYANAYGTDRYGYGEQELAIIGEGHPDYKPEAHPIASPVYFVTFILLGTMIVLNLFTGVIVGSMEESQEEAAEHARQRKRELTGKISPADDLGELEAKLDEIAQNIRSVKRRLEKGETS
jgi:voltage-gated sodium channel